MNKKPTIEQNKMNENKSILLDCTLRDGGYYTNWDFSDELISSYLDAVDQSGVDFLEIGFRFTPKEKYLGAFAYCTDEFLDTLPLPKKVKLGVMLNAKDYCEASGGPIEAIKKYFKPKHQSKVSLVRIAAHFYELEKCEPLVQTLVSMGYKVGVNLMQIGLKTPVEITQAAALLTQWGTVSVLYFADSLGNVSNEGVRNIIEYIRAGWVGDIGIHAHNNKGEALSNTLVAHSKGASWLDATVLGMGRGAGNTKLEHLMIELKKQGVEQYFPEAIFPLVLGEFKKLQVEYEWGENLLYYMAANYNIHPTFIQELMSSKQYGIQQIFDAIAQLKFQAASSFSGELLGKATSLDGNAELANGFWSPRSVLEGRDVLIIANGPTLAKHKKAVEQFIEREKPYVISLNVNDHIAPSCISAFAVCAKNRFLLESQLYSMLKKVIILPKNIFSESALAAVEADKIHDFGCAVRVDKFEVYDKSCLIPYGLVAPYALSVVVAGHARRVFMAGMDGFNAEDKRQQEMQEVFKLYSMIENAPPIISLTPTQYAVRQASVYSPELPA